jgi:hypothetical protein
MAYVWGRHAATIIRRRPILRVVSPSPPRPDGEYVPVALIAKDFNVMGRLQQHFQRPAPSAAVGGRLDKLQRGHRIAIVFDEKLEGLLHGRFRPKSGSAKASHVSARLL